MGGGGGGARYSSDFIYWFLESSHFRNWDKNGFTIYHKSIGNKNVAFIFQYFSIKPDEDVRNDYKMLTKNGMK